METTHGPMPQARNERLAVEEFEDEVLVYDLDRHRSHCLNRTAALVWRHCDGQMSVADMAALLERELGIPPDHEAVWLALERLDRARLLRERLTPPAATARSSRRDLVRRLAMVGGLALVTSIVAPEAQAAATCVASGGSCTPKAAPPGNCCFPLMCKAAGKGGNTCQ